MNHADAWQELSVCVVSPPGLFSKTGGCDSPDRGSQRLVMRMRAAWCGDFKLKWRLKPIPRCGRQTAYGFHRVCSSGVLVPPRQAHQQK